MSSSQIYGGGTGRASILLVLTILSLSAASTAQNEIFIGGFSDGEDDIGGSIGISNPAADYCEGRGYEYSGGMCVFPDGTSCEAWAFYRGECSYRPQPEKPIGMPNPAAVHCQNQGYRYSDGRCIFPDGSSCDAWEFFRGECSYRPQPEKPIGMPNPAAVYCQSQGYRLEIRKDPRTGGEVGYCVFPDGTSCEEWAFYRGECRYEPKPKPQPTPAPTPAPDPLPPQALYSCDPPAPADQGVILDYQPKAAPPAAVYFQGAFVSWPQFEATFPATAPGLWVKSSSGWAWKAVSPFGAWISLAVYLPGNGSVSLYTLDESGNVRLHRLGPAPEGYKQLFLNTAAPGQQMAMVTLDGIPSNVVFIDVREAWTPCGTRYLGSAPGEGPALVL